jgi:hypothetical protein
MHRGIRLVVTHPRSITQGAELIGSAYQEINRKPPLSLAVAPQWV